MPVNSEYTLCSEKPTHVFFYISVKNVSIYTKFSEYVSEGLGIPLKLKLNIHCHCWLANIYQMFIFYRDIHYLQTCKHDVRITSPVAMNI